MNIDINELTEHELRELNKKIVEQLRLFEKARTNISMQKLSIGDRVCFDPDGEPPIFGVVTRCNKKTVAVITEDGRNWRVSPQLLRRAKDLPG